MDSPALLDPLVTKNRFDFIINENGNAVILAKGPLKADYCWLQYDSHTGTVQLVTEGGELQEMGYKLTDFVKDSLEKTREIALIEIDDNRVCQKIRKVVFTTVLN